jgi:hypothetical protein
MEKIYLIGLVIYCIQFIIYTQYLGTELQIDAPCIILQYVYKPTRCTEFL